MSGQDRGRLIAALAALASEAGARIVRAAEQGLAPRDKGGKIDVAGAMQTITTVIESWVREHPEQWLWLHQRWR